MLRLLIFLCISFFVPSISFSQIQYRAEIKRADGYHIVFNLEEYRTSGKYSWVIKNASERIQVNDIRLKGDSVFVDMPFFEAQLMLKKTALGYQGNWKKPVPKEMSSCL